MTTEQPKKQLSEERLRQLADMRIKAQEAKRKKAELRKAEMEEKKEEFNRKYEEKVLKKKQPPPTPTNTPEPPQEETEEEIYERPQEQDESESETEMNVPIKPAPKQKKTVVPKQPPTPNYKQEYYKWKLVKAQREMEQMSFASQYARQSPYIHATDIARDQIKQNVDKAVYDRVYKELFGSS